MWRTRWYVLMPWLLAGAVFVGGCATKKALKAYRERFEAEVGNANYDGYVELWGPPDAKEHISSGWVAQWHHSYGVRAVGGQNWARAHEMHDNVTLTFDEEGILKKWRVWVQR